MFSSYIEKMFKQKTRVFHGTFQYICEKLGSHLRKQYTPIKDLILVENKVIMSLMRIGSGNEWEWCTINE